MKKIAIFTATMVALIGISTANVQAAPITKAVPIIPLDSANPLTNPVIGSLGGIYTSDIPNLAYLQPVGNSTGLLPGGDNANTGNNTTNLYAWKADVSTICEGAKINALRVTADITTGPSHDGATSNTILLIASNNAVVEGILSIASGSDGAATFPGQAPTGSVLGGVHGISAAGHIDATWTNTLSNDSVVILVNQNNAYNTPTAWMQTDITVAEVTYDDATCVAPENTLNTADKSTPTSSATLAKTGQSPAVYTLAALIGILSSLAIVMKRFAIARANNK